MKVSKISLYSNKKNINKQNNYLTPIFRSKLNNANIETILHKIGFSIYDSQIVSENIIKTYNHPKRGYHGVKHILDMLESFEKFMTWSNQSILIKDPDAFKFAILMHDYVNGEPDEVEKSAMKAKKILYKISPNYDFSYIESLIMATDYSSPQKLNFEQKLMQDIDLEILGKPFEEYKKYSDAIREQYANYPDEIYKPARKKILKTFINKNSVYNTEYYKIKYETQARENIEQEIAFLER